jgi:peptide/nickel transport system permease protein
VRDRLREVLRYPSAVAGLAIIAFLVAVAAYAVVAIPYAEAIRLWRGGEDVWIESPRNARPAWTSLGRLPRTVIADGRAGRGAGKTDDRVSTIEIPLDVDWPYDGPPSEVNLFLRARFAEKRPHLGLHWRMPDGRRVPLGDRTVEAADRYSLILDQRLADRLGAPPEVGLFPGAGRYVLEIEAILFEEASEVDARLVVYGRVHGLAGTDHRRRDLMVALLWGTPVALAFGLVAAVGASLATLVIAAVGAWHGRWVDAAIQRVTEVNAILPVLPILVMIGVFYSRGIATMLGAVVALSIFGLGIKVYRAIFLQVKEEPYIEAARAYGAGGARIVLLYMLPRAVPVLVPQFVIMIPSFVFLEAALAVLGLGDPVLPTWGKIIHDAYAGGALYKGHYYWVLAPSALLVLTGLGFSLLGFALDRVFNPRLRSL